jgi:hypothetical protein
MDLGASQQQRLTAPEGSLMPSLPGNPNLRFRKTTQHRNHFSKISSKTTPSQLVTLWDRCREDRDDIAEFACQHLDLHNRNITAADASKCETFGTRFWSSASMIDSSTSLTEQLSDIGDALFSLESEVLTPVFRGRRFQLQRHHRRFQNSLRRH